MSTFSVSMLAKKLSFMVLLALVAGCASIDFDYPRTKSVAIQETGDTYLGGEVADLIASKPADQAGFYLLSDGIDALAMRLLLIQRAERSVDLQYFILNRTSLAAFYCTAS